MNQDSSNQEIRLLVFPQQRWPMDCDISFEGECYGTVRIWDANSGNCLAVLRHDKSVHNVRFSRDGKTVISLASDKMRLWNANTGNLSLWRARSF
jgi:WD40 repeat protein